MIEYVHYKYYDKKNIHSDKLYKIVQGFIYNKK